MLLIIWEPRRDPEKSMHYKIYALLRYALWAYVLYLWIHQRMQLYTLDYSVYPAIPLVAQEIVYIR
jgi:hypothetical protein